MEKKIRINKYIGDSGFCSRREADQLIADERVTVNGRLAEVGTKVSSEDKVRIDGQILRLPENRKSEAASTEVRRKKKNTPNRSQREKIDYAARQSHRGTRGSVRNFKPRRFAGDASETSADRKQEKGKSKK